VSVVEVSAALARVATPGRYGAAGDAPLRISLPARDIVQLAARRGREGELAAALGAAFGLVLPGPGRNATAEGRTAIWLQPGIWAIAAPRGAEGALARDLSDIAAASAAVIDQSHGRCTIRIEGARVRDALAKGCRLDLHPKAFSVGATATTQIAHIGCLLHHADIDAFELTMMATFAEAYWEWLTGAAAEFGYEVL
jgi:heterotetrameric sarcosine oxidase gamma subunit